jgi:DNA-binding transcriptional LysR family regulator
VASLPDLRLDLRVATTTEQLHLLGHGGLDVGVLQHPVDIGDLVLGPVAEVPQGVVLSRRSPLAERTELSLVDLAGHGQMLFPREAAPGLYGETIRVCGRHGFRPVRVYGRRRTRSFWWAWWQSGATWPSTVERSHRRSRGWCGAPLRVPHWCGDCPRPGRRSPYIRLHRGWAAVIAQILSQGARPVAGTTAPPADQPWDVLFRPRLTSA